MVVTFNWHQVCQVSLVPQVYQKLMCACQPGSTVVLSECQGCYKQVVEREDAMYHNTQPCAEVWGTQIRRDRGTCRMDSNSTDQLGQYGAKYVGAYAMRLFPVCQALVGMHYGTWRELETIQDWIPITKGGHLLDLAGISFSACDYQNYRFLESVQEATALLRPNIDIWPMGYIAGSGTFFRCVLNGITTYGRRNALMGNKAEKVSTHRRQKQRIPGGRGCDVSYPATLVPRLRYFKLPTTGVTLSNSSPWCVKLKCMQLAHTHLTMSCAILVCLCQTQCASAYALGLVSPDQHSPMQYHNVLVGPVQHQAFQKFFMCTSVAPSILHVCLACHFRQTSALS